MSLLRPGEAAQLVREWNPPPRAPTGLPLQRRFAAQVERVPDAVALACGERQVSYRELDRRAERLRRRLARRGVGVNVAVGLYLERSVETGVGVLGVLKAGGVCVPLDPAYPADRLRFMIADSAAPVVLTQERLAGRLRELAGDGVELLAIDGDPPNRRAPLAGGGEAPPARKTSRSISGST